MKTGLKATLPLLLFLTSCMPFQWDRNVEQHGIRFVKVRQDKKSGTIIGLTSESFRMDTFEVEKGWVHLNPDGSLKTFQTASPVRLRDFTLPAKTWISIDSAHSALNCVLPDNMVVQGIECKGGGGISGIYAGFYPSGRLKGCYPVHGITVDGIPCSNTLLFPVSLYENGRLESCQLSSPVTLDGQIFKTGTRIRITPDGKINQIK